MIDIVSDGGDQTTSFVQLIQQPLDAILFQKHGGRLQHVGGVGGVVVRVFGMVMTFDHGQPCVQRPFVAAQSLVYFEVCQQIHSQMHQRSAGKNHNSYTY